jgi:hypothetical protein
MFANLSFLFDVNHPQFASLLSNNKPFSPLNAAYKPFNQLLRFTLPTIPNIGSIVEHNGDNIVGIPIK